MGKVFISFLIFAISVISEVKAMDVESTNFKDGQMIPKRFTCDGDDISPSISWSSFPKNTRSFVVIMTDPDAPGGTFTHWVVYDIPSSVQKLEENFPKLTKVDGIKQGMNDFNRRGYGGPCPPKGHGYHRYFFKVYAIDLESLGLKAGASRKDVEQKMKGHILQEGQIMGVYRRD